MRFRLVILSVVSALLASLAIACGDDEEESGDSQTIEPSAVTVEEEVDIADFSFTPNVIEATLGNTVALSLKNDGEQDHTFTIDEFVVDEEVAAGSDSDVEFVPNEAGEFTYYCRFHPGDMQGAIRIARQGEEVPGGDAEASPTEDTSGGGGGIGY
jgi:plastocyanin